LWYKSQVESLLRQLFGKLSDPPTLADFRARFDANYRSCTWSPHPKYSVFTQYDQAWYLQHRAAFEHKYRCFYAVSKTMAPTSIIELGTSAGSSGDAYMSGSPAASFLGFDTFGAVPRRDNGELWDPYVIASELFRDRGFKDWRLVRKNLREMNELPEKADLVVVDAAHDPINEYADLRLALTANPAYIFIDDTDDRNNAGPALHRFRTEDLAGRVEFAFPVKYVGGGVVLKLGEGN
jgi:hypothetical protein